MSCHDNMKPYNTSTLFLRYQNCSSEDQLSSGAKGVVAASRGTNEKASENKEERNALDDDDPATEIAFAIVELCEEEDGSFVLRVSLEGSHTPSVSVCRFTDDFASLYVAWDALPHLHAFCRIVKFPLDKDVLVPPSNNFVSIEADVFDSTIPISIDTVLSSESVRHACSTHGISTAAIHHMIRQTQNAIKILPCRSDQALNVHQFLAFSCLLEQRIADEHSARPELKVAARIDAGEDAKQTELNGFARDSKVQSVVSKDGIPKTILKSSGEIDSPSSFASTGRWSDASYDCARDKSCSREAEFESKDPVIRASAEGAAVEPFGSDDWGSTEATSFNRSVKLSPRYHEAVPSEEEGRSRDDLPTAPTETRRFTTQSPFNEPNISSNTDGNASLKSAFNGRDNNGEDTAPCSNVLSIRKHTARDGDRLDESTQQQHVSNRDKKTTAKDMFTSQTDVYNDSEEKELARSPSGVSMDVIYTASGGNSSRIVKGSNGEDKILYSPSSAATAVAADVIEASYGKQLSSRTFTDGNSYDEAGVPSHPVKTSSVYKHAKGKTPNATAQISAEATIYDEDTDAINPRSSSALSAEAERKPEARPHSARSTFLVSRTEVDNRKEDSKKQQMNQHPPQEQQKSITALSNGLGKASSHVMIQKDFASLERSVPSVKDKCVLLSAQVAPPISSPVDDTTETKPGSCINTLAAKEDNDLIPLSHPSSANPFSSLAVQQSTTFEEEVEPVENENHRECRHHHNESTSLHDNVDLDFDHEKLRAVLQLLPKLAYPNGSGARISDYEYATDYSLYFESRAPLPNPSEQVFGD